LPDHVRPDPTGEPERARIGATPDPAPGAGADATGTPGNPPEARPEAHPDHGRVGYGHRAAWSPLLLGLLVVIALLAIAIYDGRRDDPAPAPGLLTTSTPAPDLTLVTIDGATIRLADLRGGVVVLNLWASWCAPCREEAPVLEAIAREGSVDGRRVTVIGIDQKIDDREDARAFVAELGLTYPIVIDDGGPPGPFGPAQIALGLPDRYPATVFVTEAGTVGAVHTGELTEEMLRAYLAALPAA